MSFTSFYLIACIPVFIGLVCWLLSTKIVWWEWAISAIVAFVVAGGMHWIAITGMTDDEETWSGEITYVRKIPAWTEYYEYAVYRTEVRFRTVTDSKGNSHTETYTVQVFDHWQPTTRFHEETWTAMANIWSMESYIDKSLYAKLFEKFKSCKAVQGVRETDDHNSRLLKGDPNDYLSYNTTGWVEPVLKMVKFENRVKASPSVFSFAKVSKERAKLLFPYPKNDNWMSSDRVVGEARKHIKTFDWDVLNAKVGFQKHANVIIVGFGDKPSSEVDWQKAYWVGGKKNDLVLCYGNGWSRVFGWSESETTKRNLEQILLENPVDETIIPKIQDEIMATFKPVNWHKFDYLSLEPRWYHYFWLVFSMLITQSIVWFVAFNNEQDKEWVNYGFIPTPRVGVRNRHRRSYE